MTISGENSISATISITTHEYKSDSIAILHFQTDSKATQSLEPFFPSTRRSKPFFAPNPAAYIQRAKNEFRASAEENGIAVSNTNNFLGTPTTTREEEAEPESISFIGTTTLMKEGNRAKTDATDILENYKTLFDIPDIEDENVIIIDTTLLEKYSKAVSNVPGLRQKDKPTVIEVSDIKIPNRTTDNTQTSTITSVKHSNDFESIPILGTYNKADTKFIMIPTDIDEAISNINPINTISNINPSNPFLNYRMYKESNNVISNSDDTKAMLDVAKNMMHAEDLIVSKTNGIASTKHYANSNSIDPTTNNNINFKITWPSKEGTIIERRHTVQIENITTPNNNNIAEATGSKVGDLISTYHSNIDANVYHKTDRNNFKPVNIDGIKFVIPVVQEIANMDQNNGIVEEVIFLHPDISITETRRKVYSINPEADYAQTAGNKIILPSDTPDMFNPLLKYKIKPFAMEHTNLINDRSDHGVTPTITTNAAKAKMDIERNTPFKTANFQSNITPMVSITHPGTVESVEFSEDSRADMISDSKFSITSLGKFTDSVDETISLSTSNNQADGGAGPNPGTDFPMNKRYTLLSIAESPTLMPNAQNDQAPNSLVIKDDSLTGTWISDPVNISVDPLNIPLESAFLTANFISPSDEYNFTASAGKGTTNMINSSEPMINKATLPERRPTETIASLSAKTPGSLTPRKRFGSLIDKETANEEELTPYVQVNSVVEADAYQGKEDLPPAHNFKYFELGDSGFKRNGFVTVDTTKSFSHLSSIIPTAEVIITDRDLTATGEENIDVLYDVTKPANDKIHFKTMATKTIVNGLGGRATVKQNVEAADGIEFLPPGNSILQTGRMDHPILSNTYYSVISDNPLTMENPNLAQHMMKHKLLLSTMDNAHFTDYRDGYETPASITLSNAKTLAKEDKIARIEIINIPLDITTVANDIPYVNKNPEVATDLASIDLAAISPIKKGIQPMNEVNTFNNKPNKLEDDVTISRDDPNVSKDDSILLTADSSTLMKSVALPQATKPIKKTSLADIIIPKTFQSKSTPEALTVAVTTASQGDVDTMFYIPRYESENSFKEDITLNHEADLPKDLGIMAEKEHILKEENVWDQIHIIPIAGDNVSKGNNLAAKYYSLNSDVHNSISFKGTTRTTADQLEFENPASSFMTDISKPLLGKFNPEFQEKVVEKNSNSGAEHDEFFGGDVFYLMMKENIPKGYNFAPERSLFMTSDFRVLMKDNINSAVEKTELLSKETFRKNYATYIDEQTDPGTETNQIAKGSIKNYLTGIIPVTFSTPLSSEDINVENYYHVFETGTPLSLGYANTLKHDSFISRPVTTWAKENNLDAMDLIIIEPDKSDSEYISNKYTFELEKEKSNPITNPIQFTHGLDGFVSHTTSSKSLLYRITYPEFKTEEKYQTIILEEENSDSDILATSLKDYIKNFNTQQPKAMTPSLIDAGETFSPEFLENSSAGKDTLSKDGAIIILPEFSDLGNKKVKYFFVPHTETITTGESRAFDAVPTGHAEISTPIKHQGHFDRKGISSICNTAALEMEDSITSGKIKSQ